MVRILPPQPTGPALRENVPVTLKKTRQWRAFAELALGLQAPNFTLSGRKRRKSPAGHRNIPIFGRRAPEIGFDRHCVTELAVEYRQILRHGRQIGNAESGREKSHSVADATAVPANEIRMATAQILTPEGRTDTAILLLPFCCHARR
jgi:hypothetical protein